VKVARVYQYLYYHILFWATRRDPFPEITGFWTMAMAITLNIGTLSFVIRRFAPLQLSLSAFLAICAISLIPQYFCVLYRKRYQRVIARYESESPQQRRRGRIVASFYAVGSLLACMGTGLLLGAPSAK